MSDWKCPECGEDSECAKLLAQAGSDNSWLRAQRDVAEEKLAKANAQLDYANSRSQDEIAADRAMTRAITTVEVKERAARIAELAAQLASVVEQCAKVCDEFHSQHYSVTRYALDACAAAIRALDLTAAPTQAGAQKGEPVDMRELLRQWYVRGPSAPTNRDLVAHGHVDDGLLLDLMETVRSALYASPQAPDEKERR